MNYVIDENNSLVNANIQEIAFNAAHPVGEIYVQYPGKKDPQTLYGRGTWTNISSEFAGLFFRAEGGNANEFEGGSQEDKIRNIKGIFNVTSSYNANDSNWSVYGCQGPFKVDQEYPWYVSTYNPGECKCGEIVFDANISHYESTLNPMAGHADGPEIRPINTTIRVWERTG